MYQLALRGKSEVCTWHSMCILPCYTMCMLQLMRLPSHELHMLVRLRQSDCIIAHTGHLLSMPTCHTHKWKGCLHLFLSSLPPFFLLLLLPLLHWDHLAIQKVESCFKFPVYYSGTDVGMAVVDEVCKQVSRVSITEPYIVTHNHHYITSCKPSTAATYVGMVMIVWQYRKL